MVRPMDLIERVTQELRQRLEELRPQVAEIPRLEQALKALDGGARRDGPPAREPRPPAARRVSARRRTRVSGEERRRQLLALVDEDARASVRDLANAMGTTPNNVYGLIRRLEADGSLKRADGRFTVKR